MDRRSIARLQKMTLDMVGGQKFRKSLPVIIRTYDGREMRLGTERHYVASNVSRATGPAFCTAGPDDGHRCLG